MALPASFVTQVASVPVLLLYDGKYNSSSEDNYNR